MLKDILETLPKGSRAVINSPFCTDYLSLGKVTFELFRDAEPFPECKLLPDWILELRVLGVYSPDGKQFAIATEPPNDSFEVDPTAYHLYFRNRRVANLTPRAQSRYNAMLQEHNEDKEADNAG